MTVIPFAAWTPDASELNGSAVGDIMNVLCAAGSYLPFPDLEALTGPLPAKPRGYITARSLSGQVTIFAGTATKLYRLNNTDFSWVDVSQSGKTYGANETARWSFEQFGEHVVAVNANDDPQVFHLGVDSKFSDLAGFPPRASFVTSWGDFLVLMQLSSSPSRVHWSALNDITGWTPGVSNSDYQEFPEGGIVQGSSRSTNPLILLERAIYLGTFVPGSSIIFSFTKIHDKRGAKSPYSIATRGEYTFFADEGGFFQLASDGSIAPIGFEKVDRTIFGRMQSSDIATMMGAIDPFYSRVYWTINANGADSFNTVIVYDWTLQSWSIAEEDNVGIFPAATAGYTLEGLDAVSSNIDLLPFSLDSKVWQGGAPVLAAFDGDYRLGFFNGGAKHATLTTPEKGDLSGGITLISSMYPVVDNDNCTLAIGSRMKRGEPVVWTNEIPVNPATGRADKLNAARFQRVRVTIPDGAVWTHAQAVDVAARAAGVR